MKPLFAAVLAASLAWTAVRADDAGPAVLTIAGDVANANRPAFDAGRDTFLDYHERAFDGAFAFDLAALEALGMRDAVIDIGAGPAVFSGPRLVDALDAAGCAGPLATLALDGFGTEIPRADVESRGWILATRVDGRPLDIGGRGPLWLVFDPPGDRPATEEEQGMWPWALFFIECGEEKLTKDGSAP